MKRRLIIKYSENYWIKVILHTHKETESEGGGWYSYTGKTFRVCWISRIKHLSQIPSPADSIEDLNETDRELYNKEVAIYEASKEHQNLLKSDCKIKP